MAKNLASNYQKVQATTASPGQRVVMVYKGICKHLETAIAAFDTTTPQRFETINNSLLAAEQLIMELQLALDKQRGGEIATNLERLNVYWRNHLSEANVGKDCEKVKNVLGMVKNLMEGWVAAEKKVRTENLG